MPQLVLLHLSDVHLGGYVEGAAFDEDEDLRLEFERDLERVIQVAGRAGGIVLGGDIAGHGAAEEFDSATAWITHLCERLQVSEDDVYCVPGNHDVDWSTWDADPVLRALQEQLLDCQTGSPLDRSKLSKRFKAACRDAGVREVKFHDLRHTFATRLAASGQPMRTIQEFLGHADSKTTQIYAHYAPSEREVQMINEAFAPDGSPRVQTG